MAYFENSPDEAESSFYSAFENLDLELMKATWHQADNVYCIHPGGPAQTGYDTVLKHWSYILSGSAPTRIDYKVVTAQKNDMYAIHLVEETLGSGEDKVVVIATNTYINTSNGWRLLAHHASLPPAENQTSNQDHAIH